MERPLQASWYQGLTDAKKLVFCSILERMFYFFVGHFA